MEITHVTPNNSKKLREFNNLVYHKLIKHRRRYFVYFKPRRVLGSEKPGLFEENSTMYMNAYVKVNLDFLTLPLIISLKYRVVEFPVNAEKVSSFIDSTIDSVVDTLEYVSISTYSKLNSSNLKVFLYLEDSKVILNFGTSNKNIHFSETVSSIQSLGSVLVYLSEKL